MTRKSALLLLSAAACVYAADFWVSKPFTAWDQKEAQKVATKSPWAHDATPTVVVDPNAKDGNGGGMPGGGGGGFGGGGGRGGGGMGGGGAMGGGGGSNSVIVMWQSALPVKQAMMRLKYGPEAGTSPDAKTILERVEQNYVIHLVNVPGYMSMFASGDNKATVLKNTTLTVMGKDPIIAADVQVIAQPAPSQPQQGGARGGGGFGGGGGGFGGGGFGQQPSADFYFAFPKTVTFSATDPEIEFSTQIGRNLIKTKFKLKDMVFNGKLEL